MKSLTVEKINGHISNCYVELEKLQKEVNETNSFNENVCESLLEIQKMLRTMVALACSLPADYEMQRMCQDKKESYEKHKIGRRNDEG